MQIIGVILVTLFIGIWYGMYDISFSLASGVKSSTIRFGAFIGLLLGSVCLGYVFIYSNFLDNAYTSYWDIPLPLIAFIIVVSASLAIIILYKVSPINSICYALLGGIWGWQFYSNTLSTAYVLYTVLFGIIGAIIAAGIALGVFVLLRRVILNSKRHLLHHTIFMRRAIIVAIIIVGLALSINNIPLFLSVILPMGVDSGINIAAFTINSRTILAVSVIVVLFLATYFPAKKRMKYWGGKGLAMNLEPTLAILIAISSVLIIFSNPWIYGLLNTQLIPLSPVPLAIGALFGIGLVRESRGLDFRLLLESGATIFITPILAFVICYGILAYIVVPDLTSVLATEVGVSSHAISMRTPVIVFFLILTVALIVISFQRQKLQKQKALEALKITQQERYVIQQNLTGMELKAIQLENQKMNQKIDIRKQELIDIALKINEQRLFFDDLEEEIMKIEKIKELDAIYEKLRLLREKINSRKTFSNEMSGFYSEVEVLHKNFLSNLMERFPHLTEQEKRLATLLRLGFSTKEIAGLVNITPKSVEVNRYRLRKSLNMKRGENLVQFIQHI